MKNTLKLVVLIFAVLFFACEKEKSGEGDIVLKSGNLLVGTWVHPEYEDAFVTFKRSSRLDEDGYSFTFDTDNKFIERKNSGSCGTPPITYGNFEGTWEQANDSIINITTDYWGGTVDYEWKIIKLNNNTLRISLLNEDYNSDF